MLSKLNLVGLMVVVGFSMGCQEKAPGKAPVKKPNAGANDSNSTPPGEDANPEIPSTSEDFKVVITPVTQTGPTFNFATGQQVLVKFTITGPASASDVDVGLASPVTGGSLSISNKLSPEFSWNPGSMTQVDFRLIVRNRAKCQKVAASPSQCEFVSGKSIEANGQYDTSSNLYTVKIGGTGTGTGTGTGGNSAIIQQILGMMTGGTGTTGTPGNLSGILSSMSGGQLSSLLGMLQGTGSTGGGGDMMAILTQVMGGLTLTGEPIPGAVIIDPSRADGLNLTGGR